MLFDTRYRIIITLLSMQVILWIGSVGYAGECLESNAQMYKGMLKTYEQAKLGHPMDYFGWISQGCWERDRQRGEGEGLNDYTPQLLDLLIKIIKDRRVHETTVVAAIDLYGSLSGADEFLLGLLKTAQGRQRTAVIDKLMISDDTPNFTRLAFLKEYAAKESNKELQGRLLHQLAKKLPFRDFQSYCSSHNIIIEAAHITVNYTTDLQALDYLYMVKLTSIKPLEHGGAANLAENVQNSTYIHGVLANNLDAEFSSNYLERMRSTELRYLRNGILAFYGKHYKSKILESYFYGGYPYVQQYCRKGICGKKETPREAFSESLLTKIDVANINAISAIESKRQAAGYQEEGFFVENYDLKAFLQGTSVNLTFAPDQQQEIQQYQIDWERKQIWILDGNGLSQWDLAGQKRIRFIKKARGTFVLSIAKRFLAYQVGNQLVLQNLDSDEIVHKVTVHPVYVKKWQMRYYLTDDGRYFIYLNIPPKAQYWDLPRLTVVNLRNQHQCEIKSEFSPPITGPIVVTKNNWLIAALKYNPYNNTQKALLLIPLEEDANNKIKYLAYKTDDVEVPHTVMFDAKGDNIILQPGAHAPMHIYRVDDILRAENVLPNAIQTVHLKRADNEFIYLLDVIDGVVYIDSESTIRQIGRYDLLSATLETKKQPPFFSMERPLLFANARILAQHDRRGFIMMTWFTSR